jgi:uncharacterized protein (DUF1697 family)
MHKEDMEFFRKWFLSYVNQFSSPDSFIQANIKLKIEHTARVCENILLLAKAEKLEEKNFMLAETIALFHDLGRFEQFVKYRTFNDLESENHALLGAKILEKTEILSLLSKEEQDLILKAIEYHNIMEIPSFAENSKGLLFYLKLIRDADKLDILKLLSEESLEKERSKTSALDFYLPDTPGFSRQIVRDILNNKMAKIGDVRNQNDIRLLRLSWVFDLNLPSAFAILKAQGYLNKIMSSLPETEEMGVIRKHLENCLKTGEVNALARKNDSK